MGGWLVILALVLGIHCGGSNAGNLTLTELSRNAVLGQPFRFRCVTRGPWDSDTTGVLIFKLNYTTYACLVDRGQCVQYDAIGSYSCGCENESGNSVSYFLDIEELQNDNLGPWLCEYQEHSNIIHLEPTDPSGPGAPTVSPPGTAIAVEENNLTLTCTAECIPECTYSWFKVNGGSNVNSSSLVLTSVTPENAGNYTCVALNPASLISEKASVEVKVHRSPRLDAASPFTGRVQVSVGKEETLRVPLLSSPSPFLTWSRVQGGQLLPVRDGEMLDSFIDLTDEGGYWASLHLQVEEGDLGVYCLTASNYLGTSHIYIQLLQDEPHYGKLVAADVDGDQMTPFGFGLAVGSGATLLVAVLVAVLGYLKHRQIRRAYENPAYASTSDMFHLENAGKSAIESEYQELTLSRKLGDKTFSENDLHTSPVYEAVTEKTKDDPKRECCISVVMGQSLNNPMYGSVNPGLT